MIPLSEKVDLGQDKSRIKDPRDALRQTATTKELLARFFAARAEDRRHLQLLADEVGMGKTFVSLAAAFSVLETMGVRNEPDLEGCYQKVVILSPPNSALIGKWSREVGEFVGRCVLPEHKDEARKAFKAERCDRLDDFVRAVRKPGKYSPRVLVAPMTLFGTVRLNDLHLKQRFILSALFRLWGNSFNRERRERLLKGADWKWPARPDELGIFTDEEATSLPCTEDEALDELRRLEFHERRAKGASTFDRLLKDCREVTELYQRGREEVFERLRKRLTDAYRDVVVSLLNRSFPLVVVDEAHNWKNGPDHGTNGYEGFREHIARRTRRLLLLTATPFQLRPGEMLQLLRIGQELEITSDAEARERRKAKSRKHVESVVQLTLDEVDRSSRRLARSWAALRPEAVEPLMQAWTGASLAKLRNKLEKMAESEDLLPRSEVEELVEQEARNVAPEVRSFVRDALRLFAWNRELTAELGRVVIRHRRDVDHRLFRVGEEFVLAPEVAVARPDRHVMHKASGIDVRGDAELPHYLLMRCVSDMYGAGRRTSLGAAMTGCYSTLFESREGKELEAFAKVRPDAGVRYRMLRSLVNRKTDPDHPKLKEVVEAVVRAWEAGEKSLIFCFRVNTAERLAEILHRSIERVLDDQRRKCLGSRETFKRFRDRLVRREDGLITLLLDRPLWSLAVAAPTEFAAADLRLLDSDIPVLAAVLAAFGFDTEERADRVLVGRAVEHVIATRVVSDLPLGFARKAVERIASMDWVERPYGLDSETLRRDGIEDEDLKGADLVYQRVAARPEDIEKLTRVLSERRAKKDRRTVVDVHVEGESLWFGGPPLATPEPLRERVTRMHQHLLALTWEQGEFDWAARRQVFEALRRVTTRDAVLIRLLPAKSELREADWGPLLTENFWERQPEGQRETMAHRIDVFLEGLTAESGPVHDASSARAASLNATRVGHDQYVALVKGGSQDSRERVFGGFNSPLFPDVLVCTSVGAEGIDLHRYCRNVIHYDLAWNPAVLEQRTGRVDRIGSKTFRERAMQGAQFLEVGIPFLAGTYDERMFEELRLRAQVFEVMTGGDIAPDDDLDGNDELADAEGRAPKRRLVVLPDALINDLRVRLHVWRDEPASAPQ